MQFVLDCSVAISWCLVDENNDYANAILAMMSDCEAFVPGIWSLEIANVLLVAERRNRITQEQSSEAIALLQSLLIQIDTATDTFALSTTLALGRQEGLAETASRCGVELVTVDEETPEA